MSRTKQYLESIGRVTEYESCYQIRDTGDINVAVLRKLNNHELTVRPCRESLSGFELIVNKNQRTLSPAVTALVTAAVLALVILLLQ